uniref:TIR domain-containing protein n=1 Tax=Branchiostoma floridae TaxID=7739 RepID=C3YPC3_BRAFL|eukprot:XP_002601695.1 hypothetical protein BRAFLDRAFT_94576 [Branchiostoma floridae]
MESKITVVAISIAMALVFITQHVWAGQLPPVCQTWNSTAVVCTGQGDQWEYPTRATLTHVPPGIPESVITLDLSGSNITELYKDSYLGLTALRYLALRGNNIAKIHNGAFHGLRHLKHLDLSDTAIQAIEIGAFAGLESLERLDLCCPTLQSMFALQTGLFMDLRNLNHLTVQTATDRLDVGVFKTLTRLKYLQIGLSNIRSLPDHIFDSLTLLENLTMTESEFQSGSEFLQRPTLWSPLRKLKTLNLRLYSANGLKFGPVFRNLPNLEEIQLGSVGPVNYNVEMFLPLLSTLKRLDLRLSAHVYTSTEHLSIEPGLLTSLTRLQALDIPWTSRFSSIAGVLPELRHTHVLGLSFTVGGVDTIAAGTLAAMKGLDNLKILSVLLPDSQVIQANSFTNFPHLQKLDLAIGILNTVENKAFNGLSFLTHLDLSHHLIYALPQDVFEGLLSLNHLDLSYNNLENSQARLPETLDYLDLSHNNLNSIMDTESLSFALSFNFTHLKRVKHLNLSHNRLGGVESLPANITVLDLQHNQIGYYLPDSVFSIAGLKYLDLSHNDIRTTSEATIQSSALETLRLDNNALVGIDGTFMKGLKKLKILTFSYNHIGVIGTGNFQWLVQLVQLDLSHNEINTLASFAFRGLSRLRSLDLSNNQIQNVTAKTFAGLGNLRILNLAANRIAVIGDVFDHLYGLRDLILNNNRLSVLNQTSLEPVVNRLERLDAANNPFLCDCNLRWFVEWAQGKYDTVLNWNNPYSISYRSYKCFRPAKLHGQRLVDGIKQQQNYDKGKTQSQSLSMFFDMDCSHEFRPNRLLACVLASSGIFVAMMTVFLVDYNIGHVYYYLWMWAKWRKPRIGEEEVNEQHAYTHDAFIAYNNEDILWVINEAIENLEPDYSLVIHERDFAVGAPIVENIADAVENSRRTVCIVTRNFLKSKWCEYEFQLAQYHMFEQGGGVRLILVFLEEIPNRMLKRFRHLNAVVKRDTYLMWPADVRHRPLFWRRLRDALGEPLPRDPEPQQVHVPTLEHHIPEQMEQANVGIIPERQTQPTGRNVPEHRGQAPANNILEPRIQDQEGNIPEQKMLHPFRDIPEQQKIMTLECDIPEENVHALELGLFVPKQTENCVARNTAKQRIDPQGNIKESESEDDWCGPGDDIILLPL